METMRKELRREGIEVEFISINTKSGADEEDQKQLVEKTSFPLFQDTWELDAWAKHGGAKDDIYIYGRDGLLRSFLPANGSVGTNLRTSSGYANLKKAILAAVDE